MDQYSVSASPHIMSQKIYTPDVPAVSIPSESIATHLFTPHPGCPSHFIGRHPGHRPAFVDTLTGTTITRAQLKSLAFQLGHGLNTIGARRGDTILVFSPNSLAYPVVVLGAIAAGIRCTLANPAYTGSELAHQYHDSSSHFIITTADGLPTVREMFKTLSISEKEGDKWIIVLSDGLSWAGGPASPSRNEAKGLLTVDELLTRGSLPKEESFDGEAARTETAFLCYSSGTTGKPKGVETTHRNVVSVVNIVEPLFPKLTTEDRMLAILPFYHIFGLVKSLFFGINVGVTTYIQQRFEPVQFCANIERHKITLALIVPPVLVLLARHEAVEKYNLSSLRYMVSGAAPLGAALVKQVKARIATTWQANLVIVQGYGLTETSPTTHLLPFADDVRKVGSIGILLPNLEARIVADDVGGKIIDAEEGQQGELWIRGPSIMKGYLNNPSATQDSITPDGWFKTGDIATKDKEGYYYIVDRRKELIKYKGFQGKSTDIPPAELESVLLTHPGVADVAVIGVESAAEATELPRAYIVATNPTKVATPEAKVAFAYDVGKWMEGKVARHKYLRGGVAVIDAIPKSAAGKILRRELRDRAKGEVGTEPVRARL
ncbi:AMP binding protein [Marasmius fiardii PR-910]|nr:AMP binding protein [Marasmius fiardii PR-910]